MALGQDWKGGAASPVGGVVPTTDCPNGAFRAACACVSGSITQHRCGGNRADHASTKMANTHLRRPLSRPRRLQSAGAVGKPTLEWRCCLWYNPPAANFSLESVQHPAMLSVPALWMVYELLERLVGKACFWALHVPAYSTWKTSMN